MAGAPRAAPRGGGVAPLERVDVGRAAVRGRPERGGLLASLGIRRASRPHASFPPARGAPPRRLLLGLAPARDAPRAAGQPGAIVLLFSGVFQSLPVFFGMAAAGPLPLAFAELSRLGAADAREARRALAIAAFAFSLSALGGEPAVRSPRAASFGALALASASAAARSGNRQCALALGLALSPPCSPPRGGRGGALGARRGKTRRARRALLVRAPGARPHAPRAAAVRATRPRGRPGARRRSTPPARTSTTSRSASCLLSLRRRRGRPRARARSSSQARGRPLLRRFLPGYGAVANVLSIVRYPSGGSSRRSRWRRQLPSGGRRLLRRGGGEERARRVCFGQACLLAVSAAPSWLWRSARRIFSERCCGVWGWAPATRRARSWRTFFGCRWSHRPQVFSCARPCFRASPPSSPSKKIFYPRFFSRAS